MIANGTKVRLVQTTTEGLSSGNIQEYGNESLIIDVSGSGIYLGNNNSVIRLSPSLDHTHSKTDITGLENDLNDLTLEIQENERVTASVISDIYDKIENGIGSSGSIDTSNLATKAELAQKQDIISDIDTIRSNAANYKGTVTSVKVDNVSKSQSSGVVDLGYVNKKLTTSTSSSMTLSPNIYYRNTSTSLSTLTITLGSVSNSNIINEYFVEFTTRSSGTTVSLPSTIKWANEETPTFEAGTTYQISIINNLGTIQKFK